MGQNLMARSNDRPWSGTLDEEVTIQRVSREPDGMGGFSEVLQSIATPRASVRQIRTGETFDASRVSPAVRISVIVRWRSDDDGQPFFRADDRLVWRDRSYAIDGSPAQYGGRKAFMQILLKEGTS